MSILLTSIMLSKLSILYYDYNPLLIFKKHKSLWVGGNMHIS